MFGVALSLQVLVHDGPYHIIPNQSWQHATNAGAWYRNACDANGILFNLFLLDECQTILNDTFTRVCHPPLPHDWFVWPAAFGLRLLPSTVCLRSPTSLNIKWGTHTVSKCIFHCVAVAAICSIAPCHHPRLRSRVFKRL